MSKVNYYKNLVQEEERITQEIALSKITLEANIKSYLSPKNLYGYFEDKIKEKVDPEFSDEFELKKYLISLSLDFLYEKVSLSLFKSSENKDNTVDWKIVAKSIVDRFYINNKPYLTDIVSLYVDKGIKKWTT